LNGFAFPPTFALSMVSPWWVLEFGALLLMQEIAFCEFSVIFSPSVTPFAWFGILGMIEMLRLRKMLKVYRLDASRRAILLSP
jgi:hypothetical protein